MLINIQAGKLTNMPGFVDFMSYLFGGIGKYIENPNKPFQIPFTWMSVQLLVCSTVFVYPVRDLYSRGQSVLLLYGSKRNWWFGKCIWAIGQTMFMYLVLILGVLTFSICTNSISLGFSKDICKIISEVEIYNTNNVLIYTLILPIVHSLMIVIVEINLSLIKGPVVSIALIVAYEVASAYVQNSFLLGNYSMSYRTASMVRGGLVAISGIILLDEPINALDQDGAMKVREILKKHKERGAIIILACHDTEELEFLSDEIITISDGKIISVEKLNKEN